MCPMLLAVLAKMLNSTVKLTVYSVEFSVQGMLADVILCYSRMPILRENSSWYRVIFARTLRLPQLGWGVC